MAWKELCDWLSPDSSQTSFSRRDAWDAADNDWLYWTDLFLDPSVWKSIFKTHIDLKLAWNISIGRALPSWLL